MGDFCDKHNVIAHSDGRLADKPEFATMYGSSRIRMCGYVPDDRNLRPSAKVSEQSPGTRLHNTIHNNEGNGLCRVVREITIVCRVAPSFTAIFFV